MSKSPVIVWFRHDLRLADNPALREACRRGGPVVPLFIRTPDEEGAWPPGGASRWWLHQSLGRLAAEFQKVGADLVIRHGAAIPQLLDAAKATGAQAVLWNRRYEPAGIGRLEWPRRPPWPSLPNSRRQFWPARRGAT